jgi:predicted amidohydrolase
VCNKVGKEGDWTLGGRSMIVDPYGSPIIKATDVEEALIVADLDRDEVPRARRQHPMFRDRRPDLYSAITTATEDLPIRG